MPDTTRRRRALTVRFAVGDPEGARSAVWRLWTSRTRSDVYVSAWALTSVLKVSLHESGRWRHAFTAEYTSRGTPFVRPGQDRAGDRWDRPPEFAPGVTRAFEIMVPSAEVTKPPYLEWDRDFRPEYADKEIIWLPPAPEGYATHFTVLFTSAEVTAATLPGWPGRDSMRTRLIAGAHLPNFQTIWLVAFEQEISESTQQHLEQHKRLLAEAQHRMEEVDPSEIPELRGYLYGHHDDGTRWYIDMSMADLSA
jgi:hypothetical protein